MRKLALLVFLFASSIACVSFAVDKWDRGPIGPIVRIPAMPRTDKENVNDCLEAGGKIKHEGESTDEKANEIKCHFVCETPEIEVKSKTGAITKQPERTVDFWCKPVPKNITTKTDIKKYCDGLLANDTSLPKDCFE